MNNSGFNGTGTAFILYVILAFCMPFVFLYRLAKHRHDYKRQFVLGHFLLGLLLTLLALLCIGYVWKLLTHTDRGPVHTGLVITAYLAISTVLTWIVIPRIVRLSYRLGHRGAQLHYQNPHIHPWYVQPNFRPHAQQPRRALH